VCVAYKNLDLKSQQGGKAAIAGFACSLLRQSLDENDPTGSRALLAKVLCFMYVAASF